MTAKAKQTEKRLEQLRTACKAKGMFAILSRDPGIRILPEGKLWGGGRYIFLSGAYVLKIGVKKAMDEIEQMVIKEAEKAAELERHIAALRR